MSDPDTGVLTAEEQIDFWRLQAGALGPALLRANDELRKLRAVVAEFINEVQFARRQRDARGTGAMGAELPGEAISYIQPSAFADLERWARAMEKP
jgi:hypothetical protein